MFCRNTKPFELIQRKKIMNTLTLYKESYWNRENYVKAKIPHHQFQRLNNKESFTIYVDQKSRQSKNVTFLSTLIRQNVSSYSRVGKNVGLCSLIFRFFPWATSLLKGASISFFFLFFSKLLFVWLCREDSNYLIFEGGYIY